MNRDNLVFEKRYRILQHFYFAFGRPDGSLALARPASCIVPVYGDVRFLTPSALIPILLTTMVPQVDHLTKFKFEKTKKKNPGSEIAPNPCF